MINLFEHFDRPSEDFLRSQYIAGFHIPAVAIYDDGFLPVEVDSPFQYYCHFSKQLRPIYFDKLPIPRYWRIMSSNFKSELFDMENKRADVIYSSSDNSRLVKEVRWLDKVGKLSWTDHYNRQGDCFAKTYYTNGQAMTRKYFDNHGHCVITWNLIAGDIFLNTAKVKRHFKDIADFMAFYLNERKYNLDHVFYNTLNQSLMTTMRLPAGGEDILFWHEHTGDKIPGNMQFLMDNQTRTKHIVFQNFRDWQRRTEFLPKETGYIKNVRYLGMIYPHPRGNSMHPKALIVTNSDQIAHLKELVKLLPNVQFSIAAITEMSEKLMAFQDYRNVELYPTASDDRLKKLLVDCDIYFDINHGNEILDAVRGAFENNMLIVGFKNTLHNAKYVALDNVFTDPKQMAKRVMAALVEPKLMEKAIDDQRCQAGDVTVKNYQKVLGEYK